MVPRAVGRAGGRELDVDVAARAAELDPVLAVGVPDLEAEALAVRVRPVEEEMAVLERVDARPSTDARRRTRGTATRVATRDARRAARARRRASTRADAAARAFVILRARRATR